MSESLPEAVLNQLFLDARTHKDWLDRPVEDALLRRLYDLARMAPTSANSQPLRVVFVKSAAAKERLKPTLAPMNVAKTMAAPATAIVACDRAFYEQMPKLAPERDWKSMILSLPREVSEQMGVLNATLGGGYLVMAARALGLDVGPMGGFDKDKVNAEFFAEGTPLADWRALFLMNLGYGDPAKLLPRNPRLAFEEACVIE